MKIGIIGAGRLGICFALLCEEAGYEVMVSDIRENYINDLNKKIIKTNEPLVSELLSSSQRLTATHSNTEVILNSDVIYTLVATPSTKNGDYDISSILHVIEDIKNNHDRLIKEDRYQWKGLGAVDLNITYHFNKRGYEYQAAPWLVEVREGNYFSFPVIHKWEENY